MLLDLQAEDLGKSLQADICVVGGGPAGISIAREFANTGHTVILLESGGLQFDRATQDLYQGTNVRGDFSLTTSRFRMLGGTTYVWGGWSTTLDEGDFRRRDWVPYSGWPITKADLVPFYRRAQPLCELGRYRYTVAEWPTLAQKALALNPDLLEHRLWQLSPPTLFGEKYLDELRKAANIRLILNATATEIVTAENARSVTEVRVASLDGRRTRVRARAYVLACGGIETPRLMLASNRVEPSGLGNGNDLVGRFFMDHPHPDAGGVLLTGGLEPFKPYFQNAVGKERVVLGIGPSESAQRRLGILNSSIAVHGPIRFEPTDAWDSLMKLSRAFDERSWPPNAGSLLLNILRDLDGVIREGYLSARDGPVRGYTFTARTEATPNPDNRVTLDRERDALGMNRVRLDWKPAALDRVTTARTMELLAREFGRLGVGRVRINELLLEKDQRWSENLSWFGHHMGTTRMSSDAKSGVVDANCRVHGVDNLFIASSSVFPTSGFANPTLTILALALRLADHLKASVLSVKA
jgi:choline dehydrogenase-like flavoprotein